MRVRTPTHLACVFAGLAGAYAAAFYAMTNLDAASAWSRFDALDATGSPGRAAPHGETGLALMTADGADEAALFARRRQVAGAQAASGNPARAADLYAAVLASPLAVRLPLDERVALRAALAEAALRGGDVAEAARVMARFVDAAGDEAARGTPGDADSREARYLALVDGAMDAFEDALPPVPSEADALTGSEPERLEAAAMMTTLGGYYARADAGDYAAAGLLASAYRTRAAILGAGHPDTVQTALLVGPIYERIDRIGDAERLYLAAFHAQERAKGANNPDLGLYIRLLADVYRRQGRVTEAEALNVHMRGLFRDAFGPRRYAANRERDRRADVNRPVSLQFPLAAAYAPDDLVRAAAAGLPRSKHEDAEEMQVREASVDGVTMPDRLAALMEACAEPDERLSLRSGYRSYATQARLYDHTDHGGKVTRPGTSEHQLGLAADIDVNGRLMRSTDRAYQCFEERAFAYGFLLSYPRGNAYLDGPDTYEPWHWRFVGPRTALLYREIGPMGRPQEFLAALPCYQERALAGLFLSAKGEDMCLASVAEVADAGLAAGGDG